MAKNPLKSIVGADRDAYFWIKKKLGLSEYQMGALVWFSALITGILLGIWIGWINIALPGEDKKCLSSFSAQLTKIISKSLQCRVPAKTCRHYVSTGSWHYLRSIGYRRSKLIDSWSMFGAWSIVPSSTKPASRSTLGFNNAMPSFEQAVKSEITLKQMTKVKAESDRSIELNLLCTWCLGDGAFAVASQVFKPCWQAVVTHQNELSMLGCCIWLDLDEHPFLPVDQSALTVERFFVSGLIRLLLPHKCSVVRLPKWVRPIHSKGWVKASKKPLSEGVASSKWCCVDSTINFSLSQIKLLMSVQVIKHRTVLPMRHWRDQLDWSMTAGNKKPRSWRGCLSVDHNTLKVLTNQKFAFKPTNFQLSPSNTYL